MLANCGRFVMNFKMPFPRAGLGLGRCWFTAWRIVQVVLRTNQLRVVPLASIFVRDGFRARDVWINGGGIECFLIIFQKTNLSWEGCPGGDNWSPDPGPDLELEAPVGPMFVEFFFWKESQLVFTEHHTVLFLIKYWLINWVMWSSVSLQVWRQKKAKMSEWVTASH